MENYDPEPVIEHHSDPFPFDIEKDPSYFQIKIDGKGTRVRTLVNRGIKNFGSGKKIVFVAQGRATTTAISCVEIMKTYYKKPIYQITRINQIRTVETWYPVVEGLDPIKVTRAVPVIYILISQEPLKDDENGYQVYNHRDPKKILNLQMIDDNDTLQDNAEDTNNSLDQSDQKENIPLTDTDNHNRNNNLISPNNNNSNVTNTSTRPYRNRNNSFE